MTAVMMEGKVILKKIIIFGVLIIIAISGCVSPTPTASPTVFPPTTPRPTKTLQPTILPTQTLTATIRFTSTIKPSATPSLTPFPTLSYEQEGYLFASLYELNGGCDLPCWAGITPGQTTSGELFQFVNQFRNFNQTDVIEYSITGKQNEAITIQWYLPIPRPVDYSANVIFEISKITNIITAIKLDQDVTGVSYPLYKLFRYGAPDQILMNFDKHGNSVIYPIYINQRIMGEYILYPEYQGIVYCYDPTDSPQRIITWGSNQDWQVILKHNYGESFQDISQVFDYDVQALYDKLRFENRRLCLNPKR